MSPWLFLDIQMSGSEAACDIISRKMVILLIGTLDVLVFWLTLVRGCNLVKGKKNHFLNMSFCTSWTCELIYLTIFSELDIWPFSKLRCITLLNHHIKLFLRGKKSFVIDSYLFVWAGQVIKKEEEERFSYISSYWNLLVITLFRIKTNWYG